MLLSESLERVLIVSSHGDDEALGCGGLIFKLSGWGCEVHILYLAVDSFRHCGLDYRTSYEECVDEIKAVTTLLGCSYSTAYGDQGLIEKLDTLPERELVDLLETEINDRRPDLLLLPSGGDYDQDHLATFQAGFAAARPIAEVFGKYLAPHVFTYEMTKLGWKSEPLPMFAAYCDVSDHLGKKLDAVAGHATQARPSPHIRSEESVAALARIRGAEIGVEYAEAFGVLRSVI